LELIYFSLIANVFIAISASIIVMFYACSKSLVFLIGKRILEIYVTAFT